MITGRLITGEGATVKFKVLGVLVVLALLVGGFVGFRQLSDDGGGSDADTAGKPVSFTVTPEQALDGAEQKIAGKVGPAGRPILLERQDGDLWATAQESVTGEAGAYSFTVPTSKTATVYRVQAPAAEVAGVKVRSRTSAEIRIVAVAATAALELLPPIGQSTDGSDELIPGQVRFTPAAEGAKVEIERRTGDAWETITSGVQDEDGLFAFLTSAGGKADALFRATSKIPDEKDPVISPEVGSSPYKLVYRDEFDGSSLGAEWSNWSPPRLCATMTPDMTVVRDGNLEVSVASDKANGPSAECPKGRLFNGMIRTADAKSFTYGIFAARIRFPKTEGMHGSFWMNPADGLPEDKTSWGTSNDNLFASKGAEIDIVEYFGDDNVNDGLEGAPQNSLYYADPQDDGTVGLGKVGGRRDVSKIFKGKPSDGYHVYSVEWTPEEYIFRMDGQETMRSKIGVSQVPQFLILSLLTYTKPTAELEALKLSTLPQTMKVDWVRVWQR